MRTVTLSLVPAASRYNLRVMQDEGRENYLRDWTTQPGASRLDAVVGEGKRMSIGLFEGEKMTAITSLQVINGRVIFEGKPVLPVIGTTWEGLFQDVRIVPSLFAKKEK